ncbi:hypothetical protein XV92_08825 [Vibrio metoecus]|uniref:WbuO n=1 Tax=Vibrio metoecus TaxID=1481663 RepID=A0A0Q0Z0N5_VIBMT|nr:hypothetical protein XV92_08825 [Vibrio metoecus]
MIFYFIPFLYFFETRVKTTYSKVSWLFIYIIPLLLFLYIENGINVFQTLLYVACVYSAYEMGYIFNDAVTTKREVNPTRRLDKEQQGFFDKFEPYIFLGRSLILSLLLYLYHFFYGGVYLLIINIFLIIVVFWVYNSIRNRFNLILHLVLVTLRFAFIGYSLSGFDSFIVLFFLFPLVNFLERASQTRFNLIFFQKLIFSNKTSGRYCYYFMCTLLACLLQLSHLTIGMFFYFFLYRLLSLILVKVTRVTI